VDYKEVFERRHLFGLAGRTAFAGALLSWSGAAQEFRMADGRLIFNVRQFGAGGDGKTKDTAPIQKAIDACNAARGGIVYFTPGDYLTNTIVLKSHVTLYLESGATICGRPRTRGLDTFPVLRQRATRAGAVFDAANRPAKS